MTEASVPLFIAFVGGKGSRGPCLWNPNCAQAETPACLTFKCLRPPNAWVGTCVLARAHIGIAWGKPEKFQMPRFPLRTDSI